MTSINLTPIKLIGRRGHTRTSPRLFASAVALALIHHASPAHAQDLRKFDARYFDTFAPRTAADMIERLPGFQLTAGSEDRGLGAGGANVLINGQLITGKGETPLEQLSRIPATNVLHIEIVDGETLDIPGLNGPVADIVTRGGQTSGTWRWSPEFRPRNEAALARGAVALTRQAGKLSLGFGVELDQLRDGFYGPETLTRADGTVFETRNEGVEIKGDISRATATLGWSGANDRSANSKLTLETFNFLRPQFSDTQRIADGGIDGTVNSLFSEDRVTLRFDGDTQHPVAFGKLKLIGLIDYETRDLANTLDIFTQANGRIGRQTFAEEIETLETIARAEFDWRNSQDASWQAASEVALNRLDLGTELNVSGTPRTNDALIKELRYEGTLSHTRTLTSSLSMQALAGAEYSVLKQGDVKRSFVRPKGFLSLAWNPTTNLTTSARLSRDVGQINFRDFLASVSLVDEFETAANPDLVPPQSWTLLGRIERRWSGGARLAVEASHEEISDLVDRIPIGESGDAVGNIDQASRQTVQLTATLMGAAFGLDGAQFDLNATWRDSAVVDPVKGFTRQISDLQTQSIRLDYRHDLTGTNWAWGGRFTALETAPRYQTNIIVRQDIDADDHYVFVEHKNMFGMTVQARLSELTNSKSDYSRIIYSGRRDNGTINKIESRNRDLDGPFLRLDISKAF
ncbi:MAG: hypothetical protein ACSHX3_11800 [Litorimonas sp.]